MKLKIKAKINYKSMQKGDIEGTLSSIKETKKYINYRPQVKIKEGISNFIDWYKQYYKVK